MATEGGITASGGDPVFIPKLGGIEFPAADYSDTFRQFSGGGGYGFGGSQQIPIENLGVPQAYQGIFPFLSNVPKWANYVPPIGPLAGPVGALKTLQTINSLSKLWNRYLSGGRTTSAPSAAASFDDLVASGYGFGGENKIPIWNEGVPVGGSAPPPTPPSFPGLIGEGPENLINTNVPTTAPPRMFEGQAPTSFFGGSGTGGPGYSGYYGGSFVGPGASYTGPSGGPGTMAIMKLFNKGGIVKGGDIFRQRMFRGKPMRYARGTSNVLSAKQRQALPRSSFALPGRGEGPKGAGSGSYPIPDRSHARNALARVSQHGSPEQKAKVRAAVHRKFPDIGKGRK